MKHPARAAGRFEVTVLGPETTEVYRDAQNKGEGPRVSAFYLDGRFAAKTKIPVTPEAKKCLKIGCGRLKIHFATEKSKKYFQNPAITAWNWPDLPWLARTAAP